jgi:flagellin-like protein
MISVQDSENLYIQLHAISIKVNQNMKGITPVIALILLLVIVIVVVGFSFGIFQSLIATAGGAAEGQATTTSTQVQKTLSIENVVFTDNAGVADGWAISVRSQAPTDVIINGNTEVGVYIKGALKTCAWAPDANIESGSVATCSTTTTDAECIIGNAEIRVTSPSGTVQTQTYNVPSCND